MRRRLRQATARIPLLNLLLVLFLSSLPAELYGQEVQREFFRGRDAVAGEIIVRFRGDTLPSAAVQGMENATVKALLPSRAMLLRAPGRSVEDLLQAYSARPDVLYAEPNYLWRKEDLPNDMYFDAQWGLRNTGLTTSTVSSGTPGADISAVEAWDIAQGSRSVVIGIVDSGIDYSHPDLAANIWSAPTEFTVVVGGQSITCAAGTHGFNAITRTCDPMDDDPDSHGTHVAGIIGSAGNNGLGVTGVNRVASMMALKFLDANGSGSTANAIAAIEFAIQVKAVLGVNANVRVLNNSWGHDTVSQALVDAVVAASNAEILFVASAGNLAQNSDATPHYPSGINSPNVISVAATDNRDTRSWFSNFGTSSVHLGAPGSDIGSTKRDKSYMYAEGTSMAAAMVSGAAGLVLSGCNLTTSELRANLLGSVDPVPDLQVRTSTGGRLNVHQALVDCASSPPVFTLKSTSSFLLAGAAGSASGTILMNPLNGFSADVVLEVAAPPDFTVSLGTTLLNNGQLSTSMTVTAGPDVATGTYVIYVTGTSGEVARTAGVMFIVVGTAILPGQNLPGLWSLSTSQPDPFNPGSALPPAMADWYQFVLDSTTSVTLALVNGDALRLLDSFGAVVRQTTGNSDLLQFSRTLDPGAYYVVVSTWTDGEVPYAFGLNAPMLESLSPNVGHQGSSIRVSLRGLLFTLDPTIDAGSDIIVSDVSSSGFLDASANFAISATAALGAHNVRVITAAGSSNSVAFTVKPPLSVITSITPASAVMGTSVDIAIVGAHFLDPTVEILGSGVTLENVAVVNTTLITGRITVSPSAQPGGASIRVTTAAGSTTAPFQILPLPPTLTGISPSSGTVGTVVQVTLSGTQFYSPLTFDTGGEITVTNVSILPGRTTATARFNIAPTAALGTRNIRVMTSGGTTDSVEFTVTPGPPPTLTSISPTFGPRTTTRILDVRGTNFTTGFTLHAGPDISASAVQVVSLTQATVTIQIAGTAALGPRDVWISTAGGTSNPLVFTVLPPPPTLTSINPSSGAQQSSMDVTFTGTNFVEGMTVQAGVLSVSQLSVINSTTATAVLTVPQSTQTGNYNLSVVTASGTGGPVTFTVLPGIPTLTAINPTFGVRGHIRNVTLTGTNFATGSTTISPIPGVSMSISSVGGASIVAAFHIDESAPLGLHEITVTTPAGTTQPVTFSIFDPFPDLLVSSSQETFWAGLTNTFSISVKNHGTTAATTMAVTDLLPPELTFISGGGQEFSCSASGQLVTCSYSGTSLHPGGSTLFISITVSVNPSAPPSLTHTMSVINSADMNPINNTASGTILTRPVPDPQISFGGDPLLPGQQRFVSVQIPNHLPYDMTGTLTMSFSSTASNPADDPALQFATGGRQVPFVIRSGTLQARIGNSSIPEPVAYQSGTVAGTVIFHATAQVSTLKKSATTPAVPELTIAPAPPAVHSIRTEAQGGFAVLITSLSTPRSITDLSLQFFTTPPAQLSCGSIPRCTVSGSTMTLDVRALFDNWFTTNTAFGGLSALRVPISVQGTVFGSVSITLKNALGSSNSRIIPLP